jgi:hypothetical protein
MIRRLSIVVLATAALAGCVTDGYSYRGGSGDYYYGRPSADYYDDDYYGGYGYPGWYGGYGYGHGYYGYGYPYYGWYGGYWDYPYYWPPYRPPHRPRPDDDDGPRMGGNLPPDRFDRVPEGGQYARPRVREGVLGNDVERIEPPAWRNPPPDSTLRPRVREPRLGGSGEPMRVRSPATSAPIAPRPMVPAPRVDSRPPMSGRSAPRERVSRPPASRERDVGQKDER